MSWSKLQTCLFLPTPKGKSASTVKACLIVESLGVVNSTTSAAKSSQTNHSLFSLFCASIRHGDQTVAQWFRQILKPWSDCGAKRSVRVSGWAKVYRQPRTWWSRREEKPAIPSAHPPCCLQLPGLRDSDLNTTWAQDNTILPDKMQHPQSRFPTTLIVLALPSTHLNVMSYDQWFFKSPWRNCCTSY